MGVQNKALWIVEEEVQMKRYNKVTETGTKRGKFLSLQKIFEYFCLDDRVLLFAEQCH
jgi:hypothetical protein